MVDELTMSINEGYLTTLCTHGNKCTINRTYVVYTVLVQNFVEFDGGLQKILGSAGGGVGRRPNSCRFEYLVSKMSCSDETNLIRIAVNLLLGDASLYSVELRGARRRRHGCCWIVHGSSCHFISFVHEYN
jgi:hypothetical protein